MNEVGNRKQMIAAGKQRIQADAERFIDARVGVQFAVRRLVRETETELHQEREGNSEKENGAKAACMRRGAQKREGRYDFGGRERHVQMARYGVTSFVGLANKPALPQSLGANARIARRCPLVIPH